VILNLLINAAQAIAQSVGDGSQGKGKIVVSTSHDEGWLRFLSLIPERESRRRCARECLSPFFTTNTVGKGTGQGLALRHTAIVRRTVERYGFDSDSGKRSHILHSHTVAGGRSVIMAKRIYLSMTSPCCSAGCNAVCASCVREWEMVFAPGGNEALAAMDLQQFDIIGD